MQNDIGIGVYITKKESEDLFNNIKQEIDNDNLLKDNVEIKSIEYVTLFKKIKGMYSYLLISIKGFYRFRIKAFILRKKEPLLGGGGGVFSLEWWLGMGVNFITYIVLPGIAWDIAKTVFIKSYTKIKTKKIKYIVLKNAITGPCEPELRILIPNNLKDNELEYFFNDVGEIFTHFNKVKYSLRRKRITLKYKNGWNIKLKGFY
jgi:hypothetical protein